MNYQHKYFSQKTDDDGNQIWWPGTAEGVPFRGPAPPHFRQEEYESIPITYDAKTKIYDLSDEEQLTQYNEIIDRCAKGISIIRKELVQYDEEKKSWRVLLQWFDMFGETNRNMSVIGG